MKHCSSQSDSGVTLLLSHSWAYSLIFIQVVKTPFLLQNIGIPVGIRWPAAMKCDGRGIYIATYIPYLCLTFLLTDYSFDTKLAYCRPCWYHTYTIIVFSAPTRKLGGLGDTGLEVGSPDVLTESQADSSLHYHLEYCLDTNKMAEYQAPPSSCHNHTTTTKKQVSANVRVICL